MIFNIVICVIILLIIIRMAMLDNALADAYKCLELMATALKLLTGEQPDDLEFPNSEVKKND